MKTVLLAATVVVAVIGVLALIAAVVCERRMQQHRRPGVSYWHVTLRRDGAWRRDDLFTDEGLRLQRKAAGWGMTGAALLVVALLGLVLERA